MIVEDEAITAADLNHELTSQGYEVVGTADTAASALRMSEEKSPDLVLMDIKLAGSIDGVIAASALRSEDIPVIFLTAHYDERTLERAKLVSPVGYITKPFDPHQLGVAIEMGITRHRSDIERIWLTGELEKERAELKVLRGLLPICCCCKRIRNSCGEWQNVESYLTGHSDVTFTHTYCPECVCTALDPLDHAEEPREMGKHS